MKCIGAKRWLCHSTRSRRTWKYSPEWHGPGRRAGLRLMRDDKAPREGQGSPGLLWLDGDWPANWQLDLNEIKDIFLARCLFSGIFNKTWESCSRGRMPVQLGRDEHRAIDEFLCLWSKCRRLFTFSHWCLTFLTLIYKCWIVPVNVEVWVSANNI